MFSFKSTKMFVGKTLSEIVFVLFASAYSAQEQRPNVCTGRLDGATIYNAKDCSGFFNCTNDQPISQACPAGELFDDTIGICDRDDRVECFACPVDVFADVAVPNECNQFVRCSKYVDPEQITCSAGLYFDATVQMCNVAGRVECKFLARCPKNHERLVIIADRDTCNKYFVCLNGVATEYVCPPLMHFNPKTNQCDLPQNVGCPLVVDNKIALSMEFT